MGLVFEEIKDVWGGSGVRWGKHDHPFDDHKRASEAEASLFAEWSLQNEKLARREGYVRSWKLFRKEHK